MMKSQQTDYKNNVILSYLNINSYRYKYSDIITLLNENSDIICIAETKLDRSFPDKQFHAVNYITYNPTKGMVLLTNLGA